MNGQSMIQIINSKGNCLNKTINLSSKINSNLLNPLRFNQKKNLITNHLNTKSLLINNNDILKNNLSLNKFINISRYYSLNSDNDEKYKNIEESSNSDASNSNDNNDIGASAGSFLAHSLFDALDEFRRLYHERKLSSIGKNKVLTDEDDSIPNPKEPELTPAMVTRLLRKHEFSTFSKEDEKTKETQNENEIDNKDNYKANLQENRTSVIGYENNFINSNNPIEDQHIQAFYKDKLIFGVYDGHSGTECGKVVAKQLHNYIASALEKIKLPKIPDNLDSDNTLDNKRRIKIEERVNKMTNAIKKAFINLDKDIINGNVNFTSDEINEEEDDDIGKIYTSPLNNEEIVKKQMMTALSGACALVAVIDNETDDLYVACTGDSRAVLGRKVKKNDCNENKCTDKDYIYEAIPLSIDQTLRNKDEMERMKKEHPNESETMFIRNRVLGGLMPTRTFGDSRYKWSSKVQKSIVTPKFISRRPLPFYYTPPYITAEPVVTCHPLSEEDQFLVMATDGIWDVLSNEDVVNLVSQYLEEKKKNDQKELINETKLPPSLLIKKKTAEEIQNSRSNLIISDRQVPAILKDSNSATHIIRNALGGSDDKYISDLLSIPSPKCRNYRDDMTVTVIYFDKDNSNTKTEKLDISKHFIKAKPKNSSKKNLLNEWVKFANKN